ncbi:hypothetical protein BX661DRAFT_179158 [Kickxella alabastrina]|uniref:uncharacterized protein n=1 Tax=Kickxella alabastrina TaxID=61397 RepID=UPI00222096F4|nr:uncharacterized protein BX661DRAFT_179158 [Kickxella alabastrina]KAI7833094.1 hypothetical protein BX661DRAFT_179158 [Kickxella alabastrina]
MCYNYFCKSCRTYITIMFCSSFETTGNCTHGSLNLCDQRCPECFAKYSKRTMAMTKAGS